MHVTGSYDLLVIKFLCVRVGHQVKCIDHKLTSIVCSTILQGDHDGEPQFAFESQDDFPTIFLASLILLVSFLAFLLVPLLVPLKKPLVKSSNRQLKIALEVKKRFFRLFLKSLEIGNVVLNLLAAGSPEPEKKTFSIKTNCS